MAENLVNSVRKALEILDILLFEDYKREGISLSALSKQTGIRPNTLHNILKTMVHCGYVCQNDKSAYMVGRKCYQIGKDNKLRSLLAQEILPLLKTLCENVNEGIVFYTLVNGGKVPQFSIQNNEIINIDYVKYNALNFYAKITSRVLAAFADEEELGQIVRRYGLPGEYWNGINDIQTLKRHLNEIRNKGYEILVEKEQVISFAVPVITETGELFGTIGCYAPLFRCDDNKQTYMIDKMKNTANKIQTLISQS